MYQWPRNSCLNCKFWFVTSYLSPTLQGLFCVCVSACVHERQVTMIVLLTQVLCIMRLTITKPLFIAKQLFCMYHYCKLCAADLLHLCFHRFYQLYNKAWQVLAKHLTLVCRTIWWIAENSVMQLWLGDDVARTGKNWQDWLLLMTDDVWVMREHKPWAILGAYKEFIRCVMLYLHKNLWNLFNLS